MTEQTFIQFAAVHVAGLERLGRDRCIPVIQPQLGFPRLLIHPVAGKTVARQNGADFFAVVRHRCRRIARIRPRPRGEPLQQKSCDQWGKMDEAGLHHGERRALDYQGSHPPPQRVRGALSICERFFILSESTFGCLKMRLKEEIQCVICPQFQLLHRHPFVHKLAHTASPAKFGASSLDILKMASNAALESGSCFTQPGAGFRFPEDDF